MFNIFIMCKCQINFIFKSGNKYVMVDITAGILFCSLKIIILNNCG